MTKAVLRESADDVRADANPRPDSIVLADERTIGYLASGGYGHVVEKAIGFGYLPLKYVDPGTELAVEILGERRPAKVVEQPLYDPKNECLLS